jgi:hypothetical protein
MKKLIYLFLVLTFISGSVIGQITGDGSFGNPYTGTLTTGSFTISTPTTSYFDQIDVSGGTLIVNPGITLFAKNPTSYITISSTGALNADGSPGNLITFSADNDGDGVSGVLETWKNLTFELSTGTSLVNNAIIEHGTGNDNYGWGGGIFVYGDNITISNSTIRNCNISGDGGGIYSYPTGTHVTLLNLVIHDNSATGNGGGMVLDGVVAAFVSGCEIYINTSANGDGIYFNFPGTITNSKIHDHLAGVGVYIPDVVSGASLTNCVIYNNNTGIYFSGVGNAINCDLINNSYGVTSATSVAPKIVNSILWGNTTAQYNLVTGAAMELAYCGIQGGLSGGTDAGGNKPLSATNGADTGPNFVAPSSDFHINAAISPLVDGGTASFSGVTIPGTDIEGKSRIGTLDIGAYEFIYFIWTGSTSTNWSTSSNWTGAPISIPTSITDSKVVLPGGCPNYPTVSSLSLSTRSVLTINPRAALTVTGATIVSSGCTFLLRSDATGSANFITGTSVTGSFKIEVFIAGSGGPNYKWHYITTPINNYDKIVLTTNIGNSNNLLNYREDLVTTNKDAGWNWHDGFNSTPGFPTLVTSRGYNIYVPTDQTAIFTGTILPGNTFTNGSITCGLGDAAQRGWNLIGNPFTSGVDADQFILTARYIDRSIYFTVDNHFLSWNVTTHVGIGTGVSNVVPALQGFFVHSSSVAGSKSVTIPAASRIYTGNSLYKKSLEISESKGAIAFPYLKFNVSDNGSFTDESIIYFFSDATTDFDTDYDAYKLLSDNQADPQIYSVTKNISLGINGLPIPDKITVVPLTLRIGVSKTYTINVLNLENLTDSKVTLIHGINRIDLKANPSYTFSAAAGTITDMAVEFDMSTPTDVNVTLKDQTDCWYSNGSVLIKTGLAGFEDNSSVVIYDISGKVVFRKNNVSLGKGETVEIPVSLENGLYIMNISNKIIKWSKKMVISH